MPSAIFILPLFSSISFTIFSDTSIFFNSEVFLICIIFNSSVVLLPRVIIEKRMTSASLLAIIGIRPAAMTPAVRAFV